METKTKTTQNQLFWNVKNGKFIRTCDQSLEVGSEPCEGQKVVLIADKEGKETKYLTCTWLKSELKGLVIRQKEIKGIDNDILDIRLKGGQISMFFDSNEANSVIKRLSSYVIEKNSEIAIESFIFSVFKDKSGYNVLLVSIERDGTELTVKSPYTQTSELQLPQWKKIILSGKPVTDKTDFLNALKELVLRINAMLNFDMNNVEKPAPQPPVIADDKTAVPQSYIDSFQVRQEAADKANAAAKKNKESVVYTPEMFDENGDIIDDLPF